MIPAYCERPYGIFSSVVVDRNITVCKIPRQRAPIAQAVIDGLCGDVGLGQQLALFLQPFMQFLRDGFERLRRSANLAWASRSWAARSTS